jgi:transcription antitermination factor NusG
LSQAWYIAGFRNRQIALAHLKLQGFGTWIPTIPDEIYHHGRLHYIERPLFGNYLLVNFDPDEDKWWRVNTTPGVRRLLPITELYPRSLPTDFVEQLMAEDARNALTPSKVIDLARGYKRGDGVDVKRGHWSGHTGEFLRVNSKKGLIVVLLRICNRAVPVPMPPHCVDRRPISFSR